MIAMAGEVHVEALRNLPAQSWAEQVATCHGNPLHLPALHAAEQGPGDVQLLVFTREGGVVACALGMTRGRRLLRRFSLGPRFLHLPTAPALAAPEHAESVYAALVEYARCARFVRLVVQPQSSDGLERYAAFAPHTTTGLVEFVLDLRRQPEAVLAGMHKSHRKNTRRAAARGLEIIEDTSLDGLLRLRQMQRVSARRAAARAEGFAVREESYFHRLFAHVYAAGLGHVLFARNGDRYVAGLAFVVAVGRAMTVRSGSLPEGYETDAMYLLHHELIGKLYSCGVGELNLGGVPAAAAEAGHAQHGLYEFKSGFGGRAIRRLGVDLPLVGSA